MQKSLVGVIISNKWHILDKKHFITSAKASVFTMTLVQHNVEESFKPGKTSISDSKTKKVLLLGGYVRRYYLFGSVDYVVNILLKYYTIQLILFIINYIQMYISNMKMIIITRIIITTIMIPLFVILQSIKMAKMVVY